MRLSTQALQCTVSRLVEPVGSIRSIGSRSSPFVLAIPGPSTQAVAPSPRRSVRYHSTASSAPLAAPVPDIPREDTYDIVIIGAANAGLALTCALLNKPSLRETTRVLLLDGGSLDRVRTWDGTGEWENRVSSLTAENVQWLRDIGVWQYIVQHRTCPVQEMIVWANPTPKATPTLHFPPLDHPMAHMTENMNLQQALFHRIDELGRDTVEVREGAAGRVGEMRLGEGGRWVGLALGDKWVRGSVVVGADGPNSPVRKFSGIDSYAHGYDTHALVATLEHAAPSLYGNNTAMQRFLPTGPLAFLPLSPTASTLVWSTRPAHAAAYKRLSADALAEVVNAGFTLQEEPLARLNEQIVAADAQGRPLGRADIVSLLPLEVSPSDGAAPPPITGIHGPSVASFPLRLSHADSYVGTRTVLVGDAAHTIHPLAGQGLNMGLADVRCLAETWDRARRLGGDLGGATDLLPYPRERWPANQLLLSTTDALHHIFRNRAAPINWARGMGLEVINELGPIKKLLMGGAGAGVGAAASAEKTVRGGWPMAAASGLEGWLSFKGAVGVAAGMAGEVAKTGLRRAADALERR